MKSILIFGGIVFLMYVVYRVYKFQTLNDGLDKLIKNGAIIIDVRTEKEFETGHKRNYCTICLGWQTQHKIKAGSYESAFTFL
ncbi:rhodanese-like domain-containing protein [Chryseobacterium schmidteae]|uniref:hypothetical protein n=1 Tax=Chryseobacterium schmidteae TaxID=2730404 RepID=UPI00158E63E8|nr:hypothetical protein [Chryseobacterium schmidteae]